ncbi:MAG: dTDP-glucose 4,6-dehydratase [Acidobacteria bacterium]|nr:dTDP-glucose 4,6-dehydratase [Acidobacteriota bacterium]
MRLLVTGGMGFIGSNFIRYALRTRSVWTIVNLDKLTYAGNPANLADIQSCDGGGRYRFVLGDIQDSALVTRILDEGIDVVVNFAAESHVDRSIMDPVPFLQTNVLGTQALLDAVRGRSLERFVQVSTDEVYGPAPAEIVFTEETPFRPTNPYAASKAAADLLCFSSHKTYGTPVVIGRPTNNYGPCQYPEKFIPLVITRALENEPIPIYGDGQQIRDWLYVEDNCEALCWLAEAGQPGEVYNIAARTGVPNREVAERILNLVGRPVSLLRSVADRPAHDRRYALDDTKIRVAMGLFPAWTLDRGLEATVQWYVAHPQWWRPIKSGEYRRFYEDWYSQR